MNQDAIANLLKEFKKLSISERNRFLSVVESASSPMDDKAFVDMKFANGIVCPHCESKGKGVTRNGKSETGRQRYLCKSTCRDGISPFWQCHSSHSKR